MAESYSANLYRKARPPNDLGAEILKPGSGASSANAATDTGATNSKLVNDPTLANNKDDYGLVDIYNDYQWTLSTKEARKYVPRLELVEYKLILSSEISGALYTLKGEFNNINIIRAQSGQAFDATVAAGLADVPGAAKVKSAISTVLGSVSEATNKLKSASGDPAVPATANSKAQQTANSSDMSNGYDGDMQPYLGLYAVEPTGWQYAMPYFGSANMVSPGNTWGDGTALKQALGQAAGGIGDILTSSESTTNTNSPPNYIKAIYDIVKGGSNLMLGAQGGIAGADGREKAKSFTGTGTDSITVTFYLLNTVNFEDIRKNWEFCYLFTYQNLANRKGINLLDPPCLYRALIPGYKQLPICWTDNLSISNVGAIKMIDITTGNTASPDNIGPNVKMVPEAYKVTFTLTSGLMNARNIFSFVENPSKKVSVRITPKTG